MWSVKNEAESFESAAVAAAREQMLTACNVPAATEPMLDSQTTWRHWSCSARRRRRPSVLRLLQLRDRISDILAHAADIHGMMGRSPLSSDDVSPTSSTADPAAAGGSVGSVIVSVSSE